MRYLGFVGGLEPAEQAAVDSFHGVYDRMSVDGQAALYGVCKDSGGGAAAFNKDRLIYGGAGVMAGLVLGVLFARRR